MATTSWWFCVRAGVVSALALLRLSIHFVLLVVEMMVVVILA